MQTAKQLLFHLQVRSEYTILTISTHMKYHTPSEKKEERKIKALHFNDYQPRLRPLKYNKMVEANSNHKHSSYEGRKMKSLCILSSIKALSCERAAGQKEEHN